MTPRRRPGPPPVVAQVLILLLLVASPPAMPTSCAPCDSAVAIWPPSGGGIPVNPFVVIRGCGEEDLPRYRPALAASGDLVRLRFDGRLGTDSFSFHPEVPLRPATRYELVLRRPPEELRLEPAAWTTVDEIDGGVPAWSGAPWVDAEASSVADDGGVTIVFETPVAEEASELALLVQVTPEPVGATPIQRPRLVPLERGATGARARVAGGSCSDWPWLLGPGQYSARLVLLDHAGNRSTAHQVRLSAPPPPPAPTGQAITVLDHPVPVLRKVEPDYTESARTARYSGVATGALTVGGDGAVLDVVLDRAPPFGLAEAAREALRQWRFVRSEAIARRIPFAIHFLLVPTVYEPEWSPR
jgi:hypothetical protein